MRLLKLLKRSLVVVFCLASQVGLEAHLGNGEEDRAGPCGAKGLDDKWITRRGSGNRQDLGDGCMAEHTVGSDVELVKYARTIAIELEEPGRAENRVIWRSAEQTAPDGPVQVSGTASIGSSLPV